jgi:tetratricopeptide (TPR) repeat protein
MRLAWRAVENSDRPAAETYLDRYTKARPKDPFGYIERAQFHYDNDDLDAAQRNIKKARSVGPIGKKGHRLLGAIYGRIGQTDEQTFHLQMSKATDALQMDDPLALIVERLKTVRNPNIEKFYGLVKARRWSEALSVTDKALAAAPDEKAQGHILGRISECHRQLKQYRQAYEYALQSSRLIPNEAQPHIAAALALVHGTQDGLPQALNAANKAIDIDPDLDTGRYTRGLILIQIIERLDKAGPTSRPITDRAQLLDEAIEDLEYCVSQQPVNVSYLVALATAQGKAQNFKRASELIDTALKITPEDPKIQQMKQKAEARQQF